MIEKNKKIDKSNILKLGEYFIYLSSEIGTGSNSTVYACVNNSDSHNILACKKISLTNDICEESIRKEIDVLSRISGKYICKPIEICSSFNNLYFISEFCEQGTLEKYIKDYRPNTLSILRIFRDISQGYLELNKQNIVHRNLMLQNIFMKNHTPKISNFGFGKIIEGEMNQLMSSQQKSIVSQQFSSPQLLKNQPYTYKTDIFSLGVILYFLVNNLKPAKFPYSKNGIIAWHETISVGEPIQYLHFTNQIDGHVRTLISDMLYCDEERRLTIENLIQRVSLLLKHQTISDPTILQNCIEEAKQEIDDSDCLKFIKKAVLSKAQNRHRNSTNI